MHVLRILVLLATLVAGLSARARDFSVSDIYPPDSPTVQALAHMGLVAERQSHGRLRIKVPGEADRDSENYTIAQIRNGSLDMARVSLSALNGEVPLTALLSAPFLFSSGLQAQKVLQGPIGARILAELESRDLIGLCFFDAGAHSIYTVDKPVKSLTDVRDMRLSAQRGDIATTFWQNFGAVPMAMPYSHVADGLRTRALDGATGSWSSFVLGGHYKVVKYFTPTEHARPPGVVIFSRRVWMGLPDADRAVLTAAARESAVRQSQLLEAYEVRARQMAVDAGVTIVDGFDTQSFKQPMEQLREKLFPDTLQQLELKRILAAANES